MIVHPVDDPWAAAAPLASTALPLTAALTAPSVARLELANLRRLLAAQPTLSLYDASEHIGTKDLACRTGAAAGEKLVCVARVTLRLLREPEVSEQLLGALQPSLQVRPVPNVNLQPSSRHHNSCISARSHPNTPLCFF